MIPFLILSPFVLAPCALWLGQTPRRAALLALLPAFLFVYLGSVLAGLPATGPLVVEQSWAPGLFLSLAFHLDGLGLLFALLITGIGALIVLYASSYLAGHPQAGRFFATLFAFMGSMLGVVLSDNLVTLFVFWELTGFTSFLLIGFQHEEASARAAAIQALIVTGAGGLALLAAAVLITQATGTTSLSTLLAGGVHLGAHDLAVPITLLVLLAAFTKSAQVPFHFWLPNAMAAPTPVSAYLHSATMVKAGIYLLARLTPILGATPLWTTLVTIAGLLTMVVGALRAVQETDLKRILAYSTVSALGVLTLLLGIGTDEAIVAAVVYLVAHACYKGTLFLVAGAVDHETGTRDVRRLGALRQAMPFTAVVGGLAALSMVGVLPFLGFLAKEHFYEAAGLSGPWSLWLLGAAVVASALLGGAGLIAGVGPFFARSDQLFDVHEAPVALWLGPATLAVMGLAAIVPGLLQGPLDLAVLSILRVPAPVDLGFWHGVTPTLLLSVVTFAAAVGIYLARAWFRAHTWPAALRGERLYTGTIGAIDAISRAVTPALQSGSLRSYVLTIVVTAATLVGSAFAIGGGVQIPESTTSIRPHEALIAIFIMAAAVSAARARSSMAAVLSLGAVGYGVASMFLMFGAPDLAMTQFSVETLTAVIFVFVFRGFQRFGQLSAGMVRVRDAIVAGIFGAIVGALVLLVATSHTDPRLTTFFVENGPTLGHGRNIVNVILVDFRAIDTMGEITVLVTAAIGVYALVRLGAGEGQSR
jgi:multicomponent Na+:H+ antiporter subunit A